MRLLAVAMGGALGAVLRYALYRKGMRDLLGGLKKHVESAARTPRSPDGDSPE